MYIFLCILKKERHFVIGSENCFATSLLLSLLSFLHNGFKIFMNMNLYKHAISSRDISSFIKLMHSRVHISSDKKSFSRF